MTDPRTVTTSRRTLLMAGCAGIAVVCVLVALLLKANADDDSDGEARAEVDRVLAAGGAMLGPVAMEGNHQIRTDLEKYMCADSLLWGGPDGGPFPGVIDSSGCSGVDIVIFDSPVALDRLWATGKWCDEKPYVVRGDVWLVLTDSRPGADRLQADGGGRSVECP